MVRRVIILSTLLTLLMISGLTSGESPPTGAQIEAVEVYDLDGTTEIMIRADAPFTYTIYKQEDPYHLIIDLQDTGYGNLKDKIYFDRAGVLEVEPMADSAPQNVARLRISLTVPADIEPVYRDNTLILAFDNPEAEVPLLPEEYIEEPEEEVTQTKRVTYPEKKYVGEKISIDFQDAELRHVFRLISDISGYNIVVSPEVKGKFSMRLIDVPWDQALDVILRNYGLSKTVEGNIIRIAPTSVLAKEEEEIAKAKESQEKAGDLITKVYPINYADVSEIKKAIEEAKILTKRGFISIDERTSSLIVKDVEKKHIEIESLINALDVPIPQVSIEAKIVEVRREAEKDLGIQWGMLWEPPDTRMRFGGVDSLAGGSGYQTEQMRGLDTPFMVNLPAIVGPGKGGNIGIGYVNAAATFALDLQLSALESTGMAKVISNPKITTSDNEEAIIMQGAKIPYQTVSEQGTQTQFIDATLELKVTPHITPEGTIIMNIEAKKNEPDFTREVLGVPTISVKEIKTQVLVNNNDTIVIGGIFVTDETKSAEKVPGLADIPIIGKLFQRKHSLKSKNELLIFITPRIVTPVAKRG